MKLCCCSRAFSRSLQNGALTQLEWIDRCTRLRFDGLEFASSHFPRTDDDYLAQLKKLCIDRGLTPASVVIDASVDAGAHDRSALDIERWLDVAFELGAPVVRVSPVKADGSPGIVWREFVHEFKAACAHAKERNVAIALQPDDSSLVVSPADAKRAQKECDSSWLRLALTDAQLAGAELPEWRELIDSCILVAGRDGEPGKPALAALREHGYIGFFSIERIEGEEDRMPDLVAALHSSISL